MTRMSPAKLAAALAAAAFGLVFSAPALAAGPDDIPPPDEPDQQQQAPEQQQQAPEETPGDVEPGPDAADDGAAEGAGPTEEEKSRYERYCNVRDGEPSHSDKAFCEEYRKKYGAAAAGGPTQEERDRYDRYCKQRDAEPSHSDKAFCEYYRKKYGEPGGTYDEGYDKGYEQPEQTTKEDDEPDSGPLAFTGLDVWQLVVIALVLLAGGFGVRRLLTH